MQSRALTRLNNPNSEKITYELTYTIHNSNIGINKTELCDGLSDKHPDWNVKEVINQNTMLVITTGASFASVYAGIKVQFKRIQKGLKNGEIAAFHLSESIQSEDYPIWDVAEKTG